MTTILPSDVWRVTHVFRERQLIESKTYQERECRYLAKRQYAQINIFGDCLTSSNYAIYISRDGVVAGGWELLPSDMLVFSARYMYMSCDPTKNAGWPNGKLFVPTISERRQDK